MNTPTLLRNGTVVRGDGFLRADMLIDGETIRAVEQQIDPPARAQIIDCSGKLVFPGVIDAHTHLGIPIKNTHSADDFVSGSRAALHGGVTTVLDFTSLKKNQSLAESVAERRAQAQNCLTDYGLHVNVTRTSSEILAEIPTLVAEGITSFKVFTTYRAAGLMLDYKQIEQVARVVAEAGGILLVHAEDDSVIAEATANLDTSSTDPRNHSLARPSQAEATAVERLGAIAERTRCQIYIVHLSSRDGLAAASRFSNILLETCPQYMYLTEEAYSHEDGRMFVASPALHGKADNEALSSALGDQIQVLATDHCLFRLADKPTNLPFTDIPNGIGGVETLLPVTLAHFLIARRDLTILARTLAENPARIFGLSDRKGRVTAGFDADLLILDPDSISDNWFDKRVSVSDWDAYTGMPALFPSHVWRRGELVVEHGNVITNQPGKFLVANSSA